MGTKQRQKLSKLAMIVAAIVVLATGTVSTYFALHMTAQASAGPKKDAVTKHYFSFNGTTGWWQGATNETSMALFDSDKQHACFTSVEYKPGTVNAAADLQVMQASLAKDGYTVTLGATQSLTMQTNTGSQRYELHQSSVTPPPGGAPVKGGQELGYVQLSNGYIKVMGYCDAPEQLPGTLPVLRAIKFDPSKTNQ